MEERKHFSNLFISIKVFWESVQDLALISKITKKIVYNKPYHFKASDKIFLLKNRI